MLNFELFGDRTEQVSVWTMLPVLVWFQEGPIENGGSLVSRISILQFG